MLQKEDYLECLHHTKEVRWLGSRRDWLDANPLNDSSADLALYSPVPSTLLHFLGLSCQPFLADFSRSTSPPSPPLTTRSSFRRQVSRALTIKSQYLSKTALEIKAKRTEAEVQVASGIMGLGLLKEDDK